jgi:hypothetical protein
MNENDLTKIGPGFYVDKERAMYFKVREFLAFHNLPDSREVRQAVWDQVKEDFGEVGITELSE